MTGRRQLALGAAASGIVNIVKVAIQLLLLPVMARLLGPNEFGLYALALPTVSLVALLADGGLGATLAREPESCSIIWSSAFWFLLLTGIVLAIGASASGIIIGYVLDQPRVPPMIAMLSLSIVFLVLTVLPYARLTRRKNLGTGALADLLSNLGGVAVAILLGLNNAGAWSLVGQYLTVYLLRCVILNFAAFSLPAFEFSFAAVRSHLASGGLIVFARLIEYSSRAGENILVSRIFGTPILGNFTFANQISKFAGEAIGNVTWAALYVQALTSDQLKTAEIHRKLCRLAAVILFPMTFLAAAAAPGLVYLLLGPKWIELTPLLQILLPTSALLIIGSQIGAILLAINRYEIFFWCSVGQSIGRLVAICAGAWIGLIGAVSCIAGVTVIYTVALSLLSERTTGCRPAAMVRGLIGPAISSSIAAGCCLYSTHRLAPGAGATFTSLGIGLAAFAACMFVVDRRGLTEDWTTVRDIALEGRPQSKSN
jgi:O-antigen/teichoic acid export membrane protein